MWAEFHAQGPFCQKEPKLKVKVKSWLRHLASDSAEREDGWGVSMCIGPFCPQAPGAPLPPSACPTPSGRRVHEREVSISFT